MGEILSSECGTRAEENDLRAKASCYGILEETFEVHERHELEAKHCRSMSLLFMDK